MANLKTAIKRVRTNDKKRQRNIAIKSDMRTNIKRVEAFIESNDVENASVSFKETVRIIDKAVQKGVIHKNNGTRQKTRLIKKVNNLSA